MLLQILITVWVGVHPAAYMLPKKFPATNSSCQDYAKWLGDHQKKDNNARMTIECVRAVGSDA